MPAAVLITQSKPGKATGPVTDIGKAISAQNARKLGLFISDHTLIQEEAQEFAEILGGYTAEYLPISPVEHSLVRNLAIATVRQNRLGRIEAGVYRSGEAGETRLDATLSMSAAYVDNHTIFQSIARAQASAERSFYKAYRALEDRRKAYPGVRESPTDLPIEIIHAEIEPRPAPPQASVAAKAKLQNELPTRKPNKSQRTDHRQPTTDHRQPTTDNRQLTIKNHRQLTTDN